MSVKGFMKNWRITGLLVFLIIGFLLMSGCTSTGSTNAQPAQVTTQLTIPDLTGTWNTTSEGLLLKPGAAPGQYEYSTLTGQLFFTKQQGKFLYGTFTTPQRMDKNFIGIIGMDNKSISFADDDGFFDCQIVNNDQINMVYRHATTNNTVVIVGTWTRVK
jgi:hypothetical protein